MRTSESSTLHSPICTNMIECTYRVVNYQVAGRCSSGLCQIGKSPVSHDGEGCPGDYSVLTMPGSLLD